jgi:tight adherence protein B
MTPIFVFAIGLVTMAALAMLALRGPSTSKATARRLDALKDRHATGESGLQRAKMRRILATRDTKLDTLATRLLPNPALLRLRLSRTGKTWTLGQYLMGSAGIFAGVAALLLLRGMPPMLALLLGLFCGLMVPHFTTGYLIKRRINKFTARFPDAIELLVRGLRSGLPISETLGLVGKEVPDPVGTEFRSVADKIKIGRTMDAALQETADRLATPEFQFFVISLQIQRETGGNLAETLSNLAEVLRKRAQMKLKIRAMSSESKASAYIVGSLPFIVFGLIWFINGSYMQNFFIDPRLMVAGMVGLVWMAIGGFIMAKMVNFEI